MILKIETFDDQHRIETLWTPEIKTARRYHDDDMQSDALKLTFADGTPPETHLISGKDGMYLCNDEGKTLEVISRLMRVVE